MSLYIFSNFAVAKLVWIMTEVAVYTVSPYLCDVRLCTDPVTCDNTKKTMLADFADSGTLTSIGPDKFLTTNRYNIGVGGISALISASLTAV